MERKFDVTDVLELPYGNWIVLLSFAPLSQDKFPWIGNNSRLIRFHIKLEIFI